jgi:hypothetical protein
MLCVLLAVAGPVGAGVLTLENGSRLDADLAGEVLVVSTGSALVEVSPETVGLVTPAEIHLKDGRVLRGALVGGQLRAHTALGELTVKVAELRAFRADGFAMAPPADAPAPAAGPVTPVPAAESASSAPAAADATPAPAPQAGLPSVAMFQPAAPAPTPRPVAVNASDGGTRGVVPASVSAPGHGLRLAVVTVESELYRDAVAARPIGRVGRGERVLYLDSIDRRLRIFNALVFDGGYWIKVRAAGGVEGWLPASTLREAE